jgi:hypothetical protein
MTCPKMLRAVSAVALFLLSGGRVAADDAVWVEPESLDLSSDQLITRVLDRPEKRIMVTVFDGGATLFPSQSTLFPRMHRYEGKEDVLSVLLAQARQKGKTVYAGINCLHWTKAGAESEGEVLEKHPDLMERNQAGGCGLPAEGKYASPFHPRVREELQNLLREIGSRYPQLDGVVLQCRLPLGSLLGYSETARVAYIRTRQIDPIDIPLTGNEQEMKLAADWFNWRIDQVGSLVKEMSQAFKAARPGGKVAVVGYANWYRLPVGSRNTTLEDWLAWASSGVADEVVLECRWDEAANKNAYALARSLRDKTKKPVVLTPLLATQKGEGNSPSTVWGDLRSQGTSGYVLRVTNPDDLTRLASFPGTARQGEPVPAPNLQADPRLQVKMSLALRAPTVDDVIRELRAATHVELTRADDVQHDAPALGSLSTRGLAAWEVMEILAKSKRVEGRWEVDGAGYRLVSTGALVRISELETPAAVPRSDPRPTLLIVLGVNFAVFVVIGVAYWVRSRRVRMPAAAVEPPQAGQGQKPGQ